MLGDNHGLGRRMGCSARNRGLSHTLVIFIGWVKEHRSRVNVLLRQPPKQRHGAGRLNLGLIPECKPLEVVAQGLQRDFRVLSEVDLPSSSAERFNSDRAGSGE